MSGWEDPTHGVKNHKKKHNGDLGDMGGVLSDLLLGLIIIVSVEVSEVCVGVGLSGELGVEVLVSFLQDQVVFVESLLVRHMERLNDHWIRIPKQKAKPSSLNKKKRKSSNTNQWKVAWHMRHTFRQARSKHLQTGRVGGGVGKNDKPPQG